MAHENQNWYIHSTYIRNEHEACLAIIDKCLATSAFCEYAIYVKGLIYRERGRIEESLTLFQSATCLNPNNPANLKQVGHSLYLLGKHRQAIEVYDEAKKIRDETMKVKGLPPNDDWELLHNKGLCYIHLSQLEAAAECFTRANQQQKHDVTYIQLGKVFEQQGEYTKAISVYQEALVFSSENTEILTTLGLLMLRVGDSSKALSFLDKSLKINPMDSTTILGWGSITQDNQNLDSSLMKYRVMAVRYASDNIPPFVVGSDVSASVGTQLRANCGTMWECVSFGSKIWCRQFVV